MASTDRVQIPFSFSFPAGTLYASTASGSYTGGTAFDAVEPVVGATVTVSIRDPNNPGSTIGPATVYQAEGGSTILSSIQTDSGGNVPGWVEPGSYKIQVASIGSFSGASINWDAVRGDGVTNIASGAVDLAQFATDVVPFLVPSGTILDYGGASPPTGYLLCNGSIVSQTTYATLYAAIGSTWNTGGEGGGNFRLPDMRQRVALGKAASGTGATLGSTGGSIDHTHSVPGLSVPGLHVPSLSVPSLSVSGTAASHSHTLAFTGYALIGFGTTFGSFGIEYASFPTSFSANSYAEAGGAPFSGGGLSSSPGSAVSLAGSTGSASASVSGSTGTGSSGTSTTGTGTTGTGTSGTNNPPYAVVNKIIKQ